MLVSELIKELQKYPQELPTSVSVLKIFATAYLNPAFKEKNKEFCDKYKNYHVPKGEETSIEYKEDCKKMLELNKPLFYDTLLLK